MAAKIIELEIGKIKFDPALIAGLDHRWGEIAQRLGDDAYSALISDHVIRVREKNGNYYLVSGHATFRLARARNGGAGKIAVKVCSDSDPIDADIFEAASLLLVPVLMGRPDSDILSSVTTLKNHVGVGRLGRDLYKKDTWREILDLKKDRLASTPSEPFPENSPKRDAVPTMPARKRGRPPKVVAGTDVLGPSIVVDATVGDAQQDASLATGQLGHAGAQLSAKYPPLLLANIPAQMPEPPPDLTPLSTQEPEPTLEPRPEAAPTPE